jgi:hypothetical protein
MPVYWGYNYCPPQAFSQQMTFLAEAAVCSGTAATGFPYRASATAPRVFDRRTRGISGPRGTSTESAYVPNADPYDKARRGPERIDPMPVYWGYNRCPPKELLENNPDHPGGYCCMQWDEGQVAWVLVREDSKIERGYRAPNSAEIRAELCAEINQNPDSDRHNGECNPYSLQTRPTGNGVMLPEQCVHRRAYEGGGWRSADSSARSRTSRMTASVVWLAMPAMPAAGSFPPPEPVSIRSSLRSSSM